MNLFTTDDFSDDLGDAGRARSPSGPDMRPKRKTVPHAIPPWVEDGSLFFITICCETRGQNILCEKHKAESLLEATHHFHQLARWYVRLFLVMPDHVHGLLAFRGESSMTKTVADWKRYTARKLVITWQKNFFDHRIRNHESLSSKVQYIRMNPVREGLVQRTEDWPYVFEGK